MRSMILTLAVLPALGLASCDDAGARTAAKGICTPFPSATAQGVGGPGATSGADASAPVDDCLHRWAYSLAKSSDPADMVGRAAVAACSAALTRWNQQGLAQPAGADTPGEPLSLVDGQPTNAFAAHHEFAQDRALFYVVQARAGHCAPPPAEKGAPTPG